MRIPILRGLIDRRILVNFRVEAEVLTRMLPAPFRPKLVAGLGMAGICLIRLKQVRPRFFPPFLGIASENAAHRIAVEWEEAGELREGVFIPRRDTSSRLNTLAGGFLFPGLHHHAHFQVAEHAGFYRITLDSDDGQTHVALAGKEAVDLPADSVFHSVAAASRFFQAGSLGYSVTHAPGQFDGLELRCRDWRVSPLAVQKVESSFFEDPSLFPRGSVEFDCALLMRHIEHEWHGKGSMRCTLGDQRQTIEPVDARYGSSDKQCQPLQPASADPTDSSSFCS